MIFDMQVINQLLACNRKVVFAFVVTFGFLSSCLAAINEDLLQLLSREPLVEYNDSYYVRVYSDEKYDGTTYTATKVGKVLMNRFCSNDRKGGVKRKMKAKIKGLEVIDYQPMYKGAFTTFKFPIQSVECIQVAVQDDPKKTSDSSGTTVTAVKKQEELRAEKSEDKGEKEVFTQKVAENNVTEKKSQSLNKRITTVEKRNKLENGTDKDKRRTKQNLNEILGEKVVLDNKDKLINDYHELIYTEFSDEY